jgi:multidrug resistance protein, MATE family
MSHPSVALGIVGQAWPILLGQLASMAYGVLDTMMAGHSSPADLAAIGLGASIYSSVFVSLIGVVGALNPIIAHHYGARRDHAIGASYVQGLWVGLMLSLVGVPWLAFPGLWLGYVGTGADVTALAGQYLRVLSAALPAALMFRATYALNVAVSRPKVVMSMQVIGLALKITLNYALIFGRLGAPRLGAVGCALASLIVHWMMFLMGWGHVHMDRAYGRFAVRLAWPRWALLREHLRLGVPMGLSYALESTSFSAMAVLIARLGTSVLGGHQIVANLAGVCYQIPLALSLATATVTAQAIGGGDAARARRSALTGIRMAVAMASLSVLALWTLRHGIVWLYTDDAAVTRVALSLVGYLVVFHVFDALQGITAFVLRAYKIAAVPMVIYAVALWGVGLIGGYFVAFHPVLGGPRGASGLWLMQAIALCLASALLLGFYLWILRQRTVTVGSLAS